MARQLSAIAHFGYGCKAIPGQMFEVSSNWEKMAISPGTRLL